MGGLPTISVSLDLTRRLYMGIIKEQRSELWRIPTIRDGPRMNNVDFPHGRKPYQSAR